VFSWYDVITAKSKQVISGTFGRFFLQFSYFLMFFNIQIDLIILNTYDQQFALTTKKSLHIIFKAMFTWFYTAAVCL